MSISTPTHFRLAIGFFACILGLHAASILASELIRPPQREIPATAEVASKRSEDRRAATWSARLGIFRSDLWAEAAVTYAELIWTAFLNPSDINRSEKFAEARTLTEDALSRAPHDGRVWLILSTLYATSNWHDVRAAESLKIG